MPSGYNALLPDDVLLDQGLVYHGDPAVLWGATAGAVRIEPIRTIRNLPFGGKKTPIAGLDRKRDLGLRVEATFLQFGEDDIERLELNIISTLAGADRTFTPAKAGELFATGKYVGPIFIVFPRGGGGWARVKMDWAYVSYSWTGGEDEATAEVVLEARNGGTNIAGAPYTIALIPPGGTPVPDALITLFKYKAADNIAVNGGTFTRASLALYTDAAGVLQQAAVDVLRNNHYRNGLRCVIHEGSATNVVPFSADGGTASTWANMSGVVKTTEMMLDAPYNGASAVATYIEDNAVTNKTVNIAPGSAPASSMWAQSLYVRPRNGARYCSLNTFDSTFTEYKRTVFDCSGAGAIVAGQNQHADGTDERAFIYAVSNGWYRIGVRRVDPGELSGLEGFSFRMNHGAAYDANYLGDGNRRWDLFGAQNEAGEVWTSYIPNTGAGTVVRADDDLSFAWPVPVGDEWTMLYEDFETGIGRMYGARTGPYLGHAAPNYYLHPATQGGYQAVFGHGGGPEDANTAALPVFAGLFVRKESRLRYSPATMDFDVSIDGGAAMESHNVAHGAAPTWDPPRLSLKGEFRYSVLEFTKIVVMPGNKSLATLRQVIP